jgi:hypothetical protein
MTPLGLPAPWLRFLLGSVPALLTVVFAGIIALLALALDKGRREYSLEVSDRFIKFAAVLVGTGQPSSARRPASRR